MKLNMKRLALILGLAAMLALLLAGCTTPEQARKGEIYVATDSAKITTVVGMKSIRSCDAPEGTVAYVTRETYFGIMQGSAGQENIYLSEIFHNAGRCSNIGENDFIREKPADAGWTLVESGTPEWLTALNTLCALEGKPDGLQKLCDAK